MVTDLDYLDQFKVIKKWTNFRLTRNPFCIPYPMELGSQVFTSTVMNPNGNTNNSLKSHHSSQNLSNSSHSLNDGSSALNIPAAASVVDGFFIGGSQAAVGKPHLSKKKQALISSSVNEASKSSPYCLNSLTGMMEHQSISASASIPVGVVQSFVSNADMNRIREAEKLLLTEEKIHPSDKMQQKESPHETEKVETIKPQV
jgi:hypothetical protein